MDEATTKTDVTSSDNPPKGIPVICSPLDDIFGHIAESNAHFKHQQRGEPDLTVAEKHEICRDLYENSPIKFVTQYGHYLNHEELRYIEEQNTSETILYQIAQLKKSQQQTKKQREHLVKNRRYEAMQRLDSQGEYFSDREMKHRDPLLYKQLVGRFKDKEDFHIDRSDLRLSTIITNHMDIEEDRMLEKLQRECEESQMSEHESSDEEGDQYNEDDTEEPDEDEMQLLRDEFISVMKQRFMDGKDADIDYSAIDNNPEYDSIDYMNTDAQDSYFDGDDDDDDEKEEDYKDDARVEHMSDTTT